jgi:hypothetical protein
MYTGEWVFPGGSDWGVTLTPHPLLVPLIVKEYSYTSTPPMAIRPVQSLSARTVELYLYSPYGPYGLYKAAVPVQ